ncbi:MAG: ABC transporter permease [Planctomycetaceae bacterium]|nr:ABC transporter permease [Planctomycetaceae bacterium]
MESPSLQYASRPAPTPASVRSSIFFICAAALLAIGALDILASRGLMGAIGLSLLHVTWVRVGVYAIESLAAAGALAAAVASPTVRTMTMATLKQALRMKMTALTACMLLVSVGAMFHIRGDGTAGGRIYTFLSYSTSLTAFITSLMTLFLGATIMSQDMDRKLIFTLATKPVARWEYLLGRWMGLILLNVMLVAPTGLAIWGLAQYLRQQAQTGSYADRKAVETEVFAARRAVKADPLPAAAAADAVIRDMKEKRPDVYEKEIAAYMGAGTSDQSVDRADAERMQRDKIIALEADRLQRVAPGTFNEVSFSSINATGRQIEAAATVRQVQPLTIAPARPGQPPDSGKLVRLTIAPAVVGHLRLGAPLKIDAIAGEMYRAGNDFVDVFVTDEDAVLAGAGLFAPGKEVTLTLVPTVQLRYQIKKIVNDSLQDEQVFGQWIMVNPKTFVGDGMRRPRQLPMYSTQTLTVSANVVSDEGKVLARFANAAPRPLVISHSDLEVLYPAGGFDGNFVRGLTLIVVRAVFMAALALMLGSFLSFPVAALAGMAGFLVSQAMPFLESSTNLTYARDVFAVIGHYVLAVLSMMLPNLPSISPGDALAEGKLISWGFVWQTLVSTGAFRSLLLVCLGCLILRQRELARVQV